MSFIVLANSTRVVLPLRTRLRPSARRPILAGILISQAKASGHCQQSFIEMGKEGLPRPFRGDRWSYEWKPDGEDVLACWLGFPNVFFASHIDPHLRISVEAMGAPAGPEASAGPRSLARIHITVQSGQEWGPATTGPVWIPEDSPRPYPAT